MEVDVDRRLTTRVAASIARFLDAVAGGGQAVVPCSPEDALGTLESRWRAERAVATDVTVDVSGG